MNFFYRAGLTSSVKQAHPAVNFLFSLLFVIICGIVKSRESILILTVLVFIYSAYRGLVPVVLLSAVYKFRFLILLSFMIQLFMVNGYFVIPDLDGLKTALFMTVRMSLILAYSSFFVLLTPLSDVVRIFYYMFKPFGFAGVNPGDMALSMTVSLRFIPLLLREATLVMDSRLLKEGDNFKRQTPVVNGSIVKNTPYQVAGVRKRSVIQTVKAVPSVAVPVFVRTFYYARQIAVTLRYRKQKDDFYKLPVFGKKEYLQCISYISICGVIFVFAG